MDRSYQLDSVDEFLIKESRNMFEIEKQFKKDFGMTLSEAEAINEKRKKESDELYYLSSLLNGVDMTTGDVAKPTKEERERISRRIKEIT